MTDPATLRRRELLLLAAGALAYLLLPGHPLTWLAGLPLRPLALASAVLLLVALFAFWPGGDGRAARLVGRLASLLPVLVMAKLALAWVAPTYGLPAWYYANSRSQGAPERSSDFLREAATRRDRELELGGDEFPLHFLNDVQRFNFYGAEAERRRNLPFSVRWQGSLYAPSDGEYRLWLTASGPATLAIDGKQVADVDADGRETRAVGMPLARGPHDLRISYARRPPRSADLKVEWELDGRRQPLAVPYLLAGPIAPEVWERDRLLAAAARGVDALFLAVFGLAVLALAAGSLARARRESVACWDLVERPLLGLFLLAVFVHAALPRLDRVDKFSLLGGGQDWLTYESFARDILINGPLMTLGRPLGEGRPFFQQPFYAYFLAGLHWLTGEDLFGVLTLQLVGLGIAGVLLYFVAKRLFGTGAAVATFVLFLGLRTWQLDWVARRLLSENLYFILLPAAVLLLLRYLDERRRRDLLLAGLLLGLAILTRTPTLLYLPLAAILVAVALRREGIRPRGAVGAAAMLVGVALAVAAFVPLRNQIVAGRPVLLPTGGGVNLQKLHRPTPDVRLSLAEGRWYAPYVQDAPTRETLEFIQQDPLGYLATYVPLALYTLGYGAAIEASYVTVWPDLVLLNLLYLAAVILSRRARSVRAALLHAFVAVHFLTMLVFAPYDYDNRYVLPMYLFILVFAAHALAGALAWLRAHPGRRPERLVPPAPLKTAP